MKYGTGDAEPFMGRDYGHQRDYSEEIAAEIDAEVRDLIEGAHDEAWEILVQYRDVLDEMVLELVEKETLGKADLERILGAGAQAPAAQHLHRASASARPSDRPPVEIPPSLRKSARQRRRVERAQRRQRQGAAGRRARPAGTAAAGRPGGTIPGSVFGPHGGDRRRHRTPPTRRRVE